MRVVTWARSSGIVRVTTRMVITKSVTKTIAMLSPLRRRRVSSHWTTGLSAPTMMRAETSTRTTGRSRIITHKPATTSTMVIMVEGEISMRTTPNEVGASFGRGSSDCGGGIMATHVRRLRLCAWGVHRPDPRAERLDAAAGLLKEPLHPSSLPSVEPKAYRHRGGSPGNERSGEVTRSPVGPPLGLWQVRCRADPPGP